MGTAGIFSRPPVVPAECVFRVHWGANPMRRATTTRRRARQIPLHLWDGTRAGKLSPASLPPLPDSSPPPPPTAFCSDYLLKENILPRPSSNRALCSHPPTGVPATLWAAAASTRAPAAPRHAAMAASAAPSPMATPLISAACAAWASATGCA